MDWEVRMTGQTVEESRRKKGTGTFCLEGPAGASHKRSLSPFSALPLGAVPTESEPLSARRLAQLTWCLVLLGLAARAVRYLLAFPIWQDEAFLCVNLLERGYLELLQPLAHHQVCPILFLWIQASIIRLLGFSEYTLRLFPLICGIAGLFLFWHVAARLLRGTALLFAVGIFAVGYPLIRYACEAKPYGCDMFASLVLFALAVHWWVAGAKHGVPLASRQCDSEGTGKMPVAPDRWLWALVFCVPLALGLSYPAVFTAVGVSLAVAYGLWTRGRVADVERTEGVAGVLPIYRDRDGPEGTGKMPVARGGWPVWVCYNVVLLTSFAGIYALSTGPQSVAELAWMRDYWKSIFPPLDSALGLAQWFVVAHTSELLQYPVGGARGASTLTTICCAAAAVVLWRRRQRWLIVLCLAPLLPNLAAALLGRYPYGGSVRFVLYMAPAVCLLAGLGVAALLSRLGTVHTRRGVWMVTGLLAAVAIGSIGRDFAKPYRTRDVLRQRDFARWFWFNKEYDGEVVCWESDLAEGAGSPVPNISNATLYLCNRRIYSPRHASGSPVRWDRISAERPLRVVRYGASNVESDEAAFERWLADVRSRYDLVDQQHHTFPMHHKDRKLVYYNYLDLYEFVPKGEAPAGLWSGRPTSASKVR